jgi:hypothetical protein
MLLMKIISKYYANSECSNIIIKSRRKCEMLRNIGFPNKPWLGPVTQFLATWLDDDPTMATITSFFILFYFFY